MNTDNMKVNVAGRMVNVNAKGETILPLPMTDAPLDWSEFVEDSQDFTTPDDSAWNALVESEALEGKVTSDGKGVYIDLTSEPTYIPTASHTDLVRFHNALCDYVAELNADKE
jgi:hypothetical protein